MNETIVAKEEQQIKADILTLEKMSTFEQSVRNLSAEVSNNMADNSRLTDAIQNTISSLKSSVKWLLDFVDWRFEECRHVENGKCNSKNITYFCNISITFK